MTRRFPRIGRALAVALGALAVLLLGIYLGGHPSGLPGPIRDAFAGNDDTRLMQQAVDTIDRIYYRKVSRSQLVDRGIEGAVASLGDQFSHYFDPTTYKRFEQVTNPSFSGIGVTVRPDPSGPLTIESVIAGTPAARAGLRRGDRIVAVEGRSLAGRPSSASIALIKGQPGTKVTLTIERHGRRTTQAIERARVTQPVVAGRIVRWRGKRYGDVIYTSFTQGSAGQVHATVERLLSAGADGILLDLRGNGGGLLDEAVGVASIFLPDGTIVSTDGRARARHVYTATGGAIPGKVPVVVLVDRGTASSAEIVTGALQDRRRAEVVGTNTYGKGVFQEIRELPNGGALDLTVGQYFLPSGRNIGGRGVAEGRGIAPDVRASDNPDTTRRDEALDAALRQLAAEPR
ncbi:MAG: S41 family peptidase [Actinobacteria bacterium]|nr:S41 family peptidase [Actinomycetota bacterium]